MSGATDYVIVGIAALPLCALLVMAGLDALGALPIPRISRKERHAWLSSHHSIHGPFSESSVSRESGKVVLHYSCRGTHEPTDRVVTVKTACPMEPEAALALASDLFERARLAIMERDGA